MTIQIGDKLAQKDYPCYRLFTVTAITPTGRIKVQRDEYPNSTYTLNPDLSIRGERSERNLQIITPQITDEIERQRLFQRIECGFVRRNKLTLEQVRSLHEWMENAGLLVD
jgi:hypothetical protein